MALISLSRQSISRHFPIPRLDDEGTLADEQAV
jgi:hypothetical protein